MQFKPLNKPDFGKTEEIIKLGFREAVSRKKKAHNIGR